MSAIELTLMKCMAEALIDGAANTRKITDLIILHYMAEALCDCIGMGADADTGVSVAYTISSDTDWKPYTDYEWESYLH